MDAFHRPFAGTKLTKLILPIPFGGAQAQITMDLLAAKVEERICKYKTCRIFSRDLNRLWPMNKAEKSSRDRRIEEIRRFAESHGWSVTVFDPGLQAVFRRKQGPPSTVSSCLKASSISTGRN
jgi:hypothetical protein